MSRSTLYKLISESKFPQRIKLSERSVAWELGEVQNWMAERAKLRHSE